ncbi:nuclear transport factor 2 family protein [Mycolicibacterium boenickei]|nr:nuclear transport factor 2 family protein [Mycolicibacterium boenickei]
MAKSAEEQRARRHEIVLRHIDAENRNDPDTALATFTRPMYDLRAVEGPIIEGAEPVRELIASFGVGLPAITYVATAIHHADHAVIVEYRITGHHAGEYNGIVPTGAAVDYPAIAVYEFDGVDLICERLYVNMRGLEAQLRGAEDSDVGRTRIDGK